MKSAGLRVRPAQQGFDAGQGVVSGTQLGLKVQLQLVAGQRMAQVALHLDLLQALSVHAALVQAVHAATGLARREHGVQRVAEQLLGTGAGRVAGHAHRAAQAQVLVVDQAGLMDGVLQALGQLGHPVLVLQALAQEQVLVGV